MKSFVVLIVALLSITSGLAQTQCIVKIVSGLNKNLPPTYGFKTDPQIEGAKYQWTFSDKFVSDSPTPVHEFAVTGSYVIEVLVTKADGTKCTGRLEAKYDGSNLSTVTLTAKGKVIEKTGCPLLIQLENGTILVPKEVVPVFSFKAGQYVELAYELLNATSDCGKPAKILRVSEIAQVCNVPVTFTKTDKAGFYKFQTIEQPAGTSYKWYFSDNTTSEIPITVHEFKTAGKYVIELLVVKPDGTKCNGRIEASFDGSTITPVVLTAKGKVTEKPNCGLVIVPDNSTVLVPKEIIPVFTLKPGQYLEVSYELLNTTSECGKPVKIHKITELAQVCNVAIAYTKSDKVGFYMFQTTEQPAGTTYKWYFSDNTISDSPTPVHEFKTAGKYVIELLVVKPDGTKCNGRIEASFDGSNTTPVILNTKGKVTEKTGCGNVITIDNLTVLVPIEMVPAFTLKPGQYIEISYEILNISSECGKSVRIHKITEIVQTGCNVPITITKNNTTPVSYTFKTADQPIGTKFYWYFGDQGSSNEPSPTVPFNFTGTYNITLKVDLNGKVCSNVIKNAFEGKTSPVLSAKGKVKKLTLAGCNLVIALENGTTLIPAKMATDFQLKENQYVEITYEKLGEKITTCSEGFEAKILTIKEIIISAPCKAYFTATNVVDATGTVTKKVEFINKSVGEIKECKWQFGDNTTGTSTSTSFVHEYAAPGEYPVCLAITTTSGCTSNLCMVVKAGTHTTTECKVEIVVKPREAAPNTFLFYAVSNSDIKSWKWSFGDGTGSDAKNPEHTYEKPGTYEVSCSVITALGCTATRTIKHVVLGVTLPLCKGAINLILFDPTDNSCNGKAIVKLLNENATEVANVKYFWSDGKTGSVSEMLCPDKTYMVQAVVEGVCQKNTSFTMMSKPVWRATNINGINNFKVIDPMEGVEYEWNLGSGVSMKGAEINYDFEKDGIYEVKLIAKSGTESSEYAQKIVVLKSAEGTSIINKSEIQIYPNPAREMLNISFGTPVEHELIIEINSMSGLKVLSEKLNTAGFSQTNIDIRSLTQGIYFLRITDGEQLITDKKFVKY